MRIETLNEKNSELYENLVLSNPNSLLYASNSYRRFLKTILLGSVDKYLLAFEGDSLKGALPTFIWRGKSGAVVNSLPFFGSNGGIIVSDEFSDSRKIFDLLLNSLHDLAIEEKAVTTTVISNPLEPRTELYSELTRYSYLDSRIGQITPLPVFCDEKERIEDSLMDIFHSKTRNMVRKALKSDFAVEHANLDSTINALYEIHVENMLEIGGTAKPLSVFNAINCNFSYDRDYRVYTASLDGKIVAALLLFYYNKTVEYFTPVTRGEFRSLQPMSALVFQAMQDACQKGYRYWNWGGTWHTQKGVYDFKKRWGAKDLVYYYYTREYLENGSFKKLLKADLLNEYPFFFTLPFSEVENT